MPNLPSDPVILLSYVNTKLRDNYPSFTDFCEGEDISPADLTEKLAAIGYVYHPELNKFI